MKSIEYRQDYSAENKLFEKFGNMLHEEDTSESWEIETAHLLKKGNKYNLLFANGCSCWDGDYDGWEMDLDELKKLG